MSCAPIIDIGHALVGSDLTQVVGTLRNFIPERMVRATGRLMRMNIDDGDIFLGEFVNGALCSVQTSLVTNTRDARSSGARVWWATRSTGEVTDVRSTRDGTM